MSDEKKAIMKVDMGAEGTKTVKMNFPSNAHTHKEEKEEHRKVNKVVTGNVVVKKKTVGKKFTEAFFGENLSNVISYVVHDILIPAAKNTIADMVKGGVEILLFEEDERSSRVKRDKGKSYVSYNSISSRDRRDDRRNISSRNRARHNFDDIILETKAEAEEVLGCLADLVIDYQEATVGDLYDLVGITSEFTDRKYGWKDLRGASASRARNGGYVLNLPRPILLD